jgi:ubiquitin-like protein Pup
MPERTQVRKPVVDLATEEPETPKPTDRPEVEELDSKTEELLDEIDRVLEENAQAFVGGFVQSGGQ